MAGVYF